MQRGHISARKWAGEGFLELFTFLRILLFFKIDLLFIFGDAGAGWVESKNWSIFMDLINGWPQTRYGSSQQQNEKLSM